MISSSIQTVPRLMITSLVMIFSTITQSGYVIFIQYQPFLHTAHHLDLPNIIKISQRVLNLRNKLALVYRWTDSNLITISPSWSSWGIKRFPFKIHSREKTPKGCKGEQPVLHATHHLDLIHISKYLKGYKSSGVLGNGFE